MKTITTHVLDTSLGRPAQGVPVTLELETAAGWKLVGKATTDADGRISSFGTGAETGAGVYRLIFDTGRYFASNQITGFYPQVAVVFRIDNPAQHYHVPLLLSPFGYSTYRGS